MSVIRGANDSRTPSSRTPSPHRTPPSLPRWSGFDSFSSVSPSYSGVCIGGGSCLFVFQLYFLHPGDPACRATQARCLRHVVTPGDINYHRDDRATCTSSVRYLSQRPGCGPEFFCRRTLWTHMKAASDTQTSADV